MALSFKERKKILKSTNTLDLTPFKLYSDQKDVDNLIVVIVPKFKNKLAAKYISPNLKSDHFKIKLDKFGSVVWTMVDGKKKVEKIIKDMEHQFGLDLQQAEERITKFIFQLYAQGFITFKEIN